MSKVLGYHTSDKGLIPRGGQPSRWVNEYRIIPPLNPSHQRWELFPSTTTVGMTDGKVPTIPGW